MSSPTERLAGLGLELPAVLPPVAKYVPAISHPCTAFDKWQLLLVDGDYRVLGTVRTFF